MVLQLGVILVKETDGKRETYERARFLVDWKSGWLTLHRKDTRAFKVFAPGSWDSVEEMSEHDEPSLPPPSTTGSTR